MQLNSYPPQHQRQHILQYSDRDLVAGVQQGDTFAFGRLFDRYAPLAQTLVNSTNVQFPDSLIETIFVDLWTQGQSATLPLPIGPFLIERIAYHLSMTSGTFTSVRGDGSSDHTFAFLEPFELFDPFMRQVFMLVRLGGLKAHEIAVALEVDRAVILQVLNSGLHLLRTAHLADAGTAEFDGSVDPRIPMSHQA